MKISDMAGRKDGNSGYSRVFNCTELGILLSKVQATVISNGSELERLILKRTNNIKDLDEFINQAADGNVDDGVFVCTKKILKKSSYTVKDPISQKGIEPDLLVFQVQQKRVCKVIELKDGDAFDTKKTQGEREHLERFSKEFGSRIPFITEFYICCFNQNDKNVIREGMKHVFSDNEILTGEEFCDILRLNYEEIVNERLNDAHENLNYFLDELIKIPVIQELLKKKLGD